MPTVNLPSFKIQLEKALRRLEGEHFPHQLLTWVSGLSPSRQLSEGTGRFVESQVHPAYFCQDIAYTIIQEIVQDRRLPFKVSRQSHDGTPVPHILLESEAAQSLGFQVTSSLSHAADSKK
jgi:hypothetical protein